jgi:hypothetical protein
VSHARSKIHKDPVAVTSSGDILINAGYFDDLHTLEEVLRRARKERSAIFIGFVANEHDAPLIRDRVQDACEEGAAFVVGRRQRRPRARR